MATSKVEVKEQGNKKVIIREFDSIWDMSEENYYKNPSKGFNPKKDSNSSRTGDKRFTGTSNFNEAKDLMKNGWTEGSEKLTKMVKVAKTSQVAQKEVKKMVYDIVGFQASVPRYLQGIPTSMMNKKTTMQKAKVITLTKAIAYAANVPQAKIFDDSVRFLMLAQKLEENGVRVKINVFFHAIQRGGGLREDFIVKMRIKSSSERFNLSKMAFPLAHPSFLRRIIFEAVEVEENLNPTLGWKYGYGMPASAHETRLLLEKNEYLIPALVEAKDMEMYLNEILKNK